MNKLDKLIEIFEDFDKVQEARKEKYFNTLISYTLNKKDSYPDYAHKIQVVINGECVYFNHCITKKKIIDKLEIEDIKNTWYYDIISYIFSIKLAVWEEATKQFKKSIT